MHAYLFLIDVNHVLHGFLAMLLVILLDDFVDFRHFPSLDDWVVGIGVVILPRFVSPHRNASPRLPTTGSLPLERTMLSSVALRTKRAMTITNGL